MSRFPTWSILVAAVALAGCYKYDTFEQELRQAQCNKMSACGVLDTLLWTMDDCLDYEDTDTGSGALTTCEDFDASSAKDCLEAYETISCEQYDEGSGLSACFDVCSNL